MFVQYNPSQTSWIDRTPVSIHTLKLTLNDPCCEVDQVLFNCPQPLYAKVIGYSWKDSKCRRVEPVVALRILSKWSCRQYTYVYLYSERERLTQIAADTNGVFVLHRITCDAFSQRRHGKKSTKSASSMEHRRGDLCHLFSCRTRIFQVGLRLASTNVGMTRDMIEKTGLEMQALEVPSKSLGIVHRSEPSPRHSNVMRKAVESELHIMCNALTYVPYY